MNSAKVNNLLEIFNKLGEAIAYVTHADKINAAAEALEEAKNSIKDKHKVALIAKQIKDLSDGSSIAKEAGLYKDPKFLEHLALLNRFAFADQLELQQRIGKFLYTSLLKRECLREPESLLIRKYSRKTEKSFVILGLVTQTALPRNKETPNSDATPASLKEAVANMVDHIAAMETTLSGKADTEIVIDPIAVYVSL